MSIANRLLGPPGANRKLAKMTFLIEPRNKILSGKIFDKKFFTSLKKLTAKLPKQFIPFPVMYNPESLKIKYASAYTELKNIGKDTSKLHFQYVKPDELEVDLFFDGTGASVSNGLLGTNFLADIVSVADEGIDAILQPFIQLALFVNKEEHKPNYVWVIWGAVQFKGIVQGIDVEYTMFDRIGRPVRAKVKVSMASTVKNDKDDKNKKESPDLTKIHVVKAGDTLPLIAQAEYSDESLYMQLAKANNLKNYRNLTIGQQLVLPPLTSIS